MGRALAVFAGLRAMARVAVGAHRATAARALPLIAADGSSLGSIGRLAHGVSSLGVSQQAAVYEILTIRAVEATAQRPCGATGRLWADSHTGGVV
jgi:hypothetical protein